MWWMSYGESRDFAGPVPLPVDLGIIGAPGCPLRTQILVVEPFVQAGGSAVYSIALNNDPGILGGRFFQQAIVLDLGANALGLTVSNAKRGCVID